MHDESSIKDADSMSVDSSVASILGIKGNLCLRHHTASQKAHAILRRVEGSDDSSDSGDENSVVYFRLFAHKQINLKPGKEILLTVASVDGRFKDQVVMFEGKLRGSDEDSDREDRTQVEEEPQVIEEEEEMIPQATMPPKMRRQWTRKVEEVSPVVCESIHYYSFIFASTFLLVFSSHPSTTSTCIQTHLSCVSTAVQADPPPLPSYTSLDIQTDPVAFSAELTRTSQMIKQEPEDSGSLSPMLLGSPASPGLPSLLIDTTGTHDLSEDMEMSPTDVKLEEIDETIPLQLNVLARVKEEAVHFSLRPAPRPVLPVTDMFDLDDAPEKRSVPRPMMPKAVPRNPFVSGGFVTDFVGAVVPPVKVVPPVVQVKLEDVVVVKIDGVPATTNPPIPDSIPPPILADPSPCLPEQRKQSHSHKQRAHKRAKKRADAQAALANQSDAGRHLPRKASDQADLEDLKADLRWSTGPPSPPTSIDLVPPPPRDPPPPPPATPPPPAPPRSTRAPSQNAIASSSKVTIRPVPPPTIVPRSLMALSSRAKEKARAVARDAIDLTGPSDASPPPDPKALMYIPSGPSSNPLNIRPSSAAVLAPCRPATAAAAPPKPKKRVVVGRGWPFVQGVKGAADTIRSRAPVETGALGNVVAYSSPSPPVQARASASKWKRIDSEISIGAGPHDDPPADTDCSNAPPPSSEPPRHQADSDGAAATLSLKDRISAAHVPLRWPATAEAGQSANGVTLLSRIGADPGKVGQQDAATRQPPQTSAARWASRASDSAQQASSSSAFSSASPSSQQFPANFAANSQDPNPEPSRSASPQKRQASTYHPLPAKPPPPQPPPRGIKRERPPSPDLWTAPGIVRVTRKRRWPTVGHAHAAVLKGTGTSVSDGVYCALHCWDHTLRIWNSRTKLEIARLAHNAPVIALAWLEGDAGVLSLGEDGVLSKWTRTGQNHWEWGRILNVDAEQRAPEDRVCLAYGGDRIAVAFPRGGVKLWIWSKGMWLAQRAIARTNVTALRFVDGGDALVGGTREGVVWYCAVPNGTMRAYAFLQSSITSIDINPTGTHALVAQAGGSACLVALRADEQKRRVQQSYLSKEIPTETGGGFGAVFATQGQAVLFGTVEGCVLVWDKAKGAIVYGMEHEDDDLIHAVAVR
ncbi:hypothetical protein B0H10DRAFT_2022290 [Mycena sp. CBHHK59/15]|nr:hypothetical protein B0H10DRAFT_2022290 [Mycena sp. CBHHK59/15]